MTKQGAWIDVYPFNGRSLNISNFGTRANADLGKELSDFCVDEWKPKAEKNWKSSWIAFAEEVRFYDRFVAVSAGSMPFYEVDGTVKAIEQGLPFAPTQGFSSSLSVGFPVVTSDGKIIFQRRAPDVHVPNTLIHEPCGYMASMNFVTRAECDNPMYANDSKLFDLKTQLDFRRGELAKTFGLDVSQVSYEPIQDFLATGWLTKELYFSTTGNVEATQQQLKMPERGEFFFVPLEHVKELINNQGRLSKINPVGYRPEDPREIPLIDESLAGLIWGYERLTGDKLDIYDTVERLNRDGMDIRVNDTRRGSVYGFDNS